MPELHTAPSLSRFAAFFCIECKNISYIVDFLRWADLPTPPPRLIKDSETPAWLGLIP